MDRFSRLLAVLTLIVAGVGGVDALARRQWDLFVLFAMVAVLQAVALAGSVTNRVSINVRPDIARWVRRRAQRTGEPVDAIVDRSIAMYRHGLYRSDGDDDGS